MKHCLYTTFHLIYISRPRPYLGILVRALNGPESEGGGVYRGSGHMSHVTF